MTERTRHPLRCECSRTPLLAMYGLDDDGRVYIHIKISRQRRIFGELLVKDGEVKILCRECYRWHRIVLTGRVATLTEMQNVPRELNTGH